jgi:amidase
MTSATKPEIKQRTTATDIAEAVRTGAVTAVDVVTASLDRIAARDGDLHAFASVRREAALAEAAAVDARADRADLRLAGVPVAIKDEIAVAGESASCGSDAGDPAPATSDHPVVARLRAAGAVVVGKTRTPEFMLWAATDVPGMVTQNPWSAAVSPAGSSGGSAAAVSGGMVPIAHAADGLGSVRLPASACGLVGLKPGRGRVPAQLGRNDWYGMSVNGSLATTVADAALMMSVMADDPSLASVEPPQRPLRVAASVRPPLAGSSVDQSVMRSTFGVAALLRDAGHEVERANPRYPQLLAIATTMRWLAGAADSMDEVASPESVQARSRVHAALGRRVRPWISESQLASFDAMCADFFDQYDVLVTPVYATRSLSATEWSTKGWLANVLANLAATAGFPAAWNVAGYPAMSVPFGLDPVTGAPIGVQLVAAPGRESTLIGVARQIEQQRPWPRTAPGYAVV